MDFNTLKEQFFQPLQNLGVRVSAGCVVKCMLSFTLVFSVINETSGQTSSNQPRSRLQRPVQDSRVQPASAQNFSGPGDIIDLPQDGGAPTLTIPLDVDQMVSPQGMTSTLKLLLLLTVLSLAPSILIMTTCFIRFVVVMGLLRQALGTQQLPPNQVLIGLCLFLTLMIMTPVWKESYENGIKPYTSPESTTQAISLETAFERTVAPIRTFMSHQIDGAENSDAVWMFLEFQRPAPGTVAAANYKEPDNYDEVPLTVLLPAYIMSELKTSFLIGFQIYLPFLIIDMVISSVLISMGMMMLPPVLISLPFKLLLFVMIDGWYLIVGMLLESVHVFSG